MGNRHARNRSDEQALFEAIAGGPCLISPNSSSHLSSSFAFTFFSFSYLHAHAFFALCYYPHRMLMDNEVNLTTLWKADLPHSFACFALF